MFNISLVCCIFWGKFVWNPGKSLTRPFFSGPLVQICLRFLWSDVFLWRNSSGNQGRNLTWACCAGVLETLKPTKNINAKEIRNLFCKKSFLQGFIEKNAMEVSKCREVAHIYIYITSFDGPLLGFKKSRRGGNDEKIRREKAKMRKKRKHWNVKTPHTWGVCVFFFIFYYKVGENWNCDLVLAHWLRLWPYIYIYLYMLWNYYLLQVWPFQGLLSGPSGVIIWLLSGPSLFWPIVHSVISLFFFGASYQANF